MWSFPLRAAGNPDQGSRYGWPGFRFLPNHVRRPRWWLPTHARAVLQLPRRVLKDPTPRMAHRERSALDDTLKRWPTRLSFACLAKALPTSYRVATGTA